MPSVQRLISTRVASLIANDSFRQFAELPERAHVVFAAADMAEAQGAVAALQERAEAAEGYDQVLPQGKISSA